jgi:hypothetical protein
LPKLVLITGIKPLELAISVTDTAELLLGEPLHPTIPMDKLKIATTKIQAFISPPYKQMKIIHAAAFGVAATSRTFPYLSPILLA